MRRDTPRACSRILCIALAVSAWSATAAVGSGCAQLGFGPGALMEEASAALERKDYEAAYAHLKRVATEYPDSPEAVEAFPAAAACFKLLYHHYRYRQPDSAWVTSEPTFMFEWLARSFADSPEAAANALFVGCPYNLFREFQEFGKDRPQLSRWALEAQDDNGIIQSVRVEARIP